MQDADPIAKLSTKRALLEADLLSCTIALAGYAKNGTPAVVLPAPDASETLRRVLDAVDPEDLTPEAARIWRLLRERKTPDLPSWCRDGLGIAYMAPRVALVLGEVTDAIRRYRANTNYAARALEDAAAVPWS